MIPMTEFHEALEKAASAVARHPQHDLTLGYRQWIWSLLGPPTSHGSVEKSVGLRRRAELAALSTRHVIPLWEALWPEDRTPHSILDEAAGVLDGRIDAERAWRDRGTFWTKCDRLSSSRKSHRNIVLVGYGAVQTLTTALRDEQFDPHRIDLEATDSDVDPDDHDSSFCSAAAYANGAPWSKGSDAGKRRVFWEWWLSVAVPTAREIG